MDSISNNSTDDLTKYLKGKNKLIDAHTYPVGTIIIYAAET